MPAFIPASLVTPTPESMLPLPPGTVPLQVQMALFAAGLTVPFMTLIAEKVHGRSTDRGLNLAKVENPPLHLTTREGEVDVAAVWSEAPLALQVVVRVPADQEKSRTTSYASKAIAGLDGWRVDGDDWAACREPRGVADHDHVDAFAAVALRVLGHDGVLHEIRNLGDSSLVVSQDGHRDVVFNPKQVQAQGLRRPSFALDSVSL